MAQPHRAFVQQTQELAQSGNPLRQNQGVLPRLRRARFSQTVDTLCPRSLGDGRHELRYLLRLVLDEIFEDRRQKQARVGANRHWPRLLLYLREIEDETDWGDNNRGLRLINASGRGPVAAEPEDPLRLAIRIDTNFF